MNLLTPISNWSTTNHYSIRN